MFRNLNLIDTLSLRSRLLVVTLSIFLIHKANLHYSDLAAHRSLFAHLQVKKFSMGTL